MSSREWPWASSSTGSQHDGVGEGLELVTTALTVERSPRASSVVERGRSRALESTARSDADEHLFERAAGEARPHDGVALRRKEQRQRRGAVAEVGARHLA